MRKISRVFVLLLVIGAAVAAQAYTLRYKDVAGIARTYQATVNVKGTTTMPDKTAIPIVMVMNLTMKEKVQSVNPDGTATILNEMKDGTMTMTINGQEQKQPFPAFQVTFDRTPTGKISHVKMEGQGAQMMQSMSGGNFMNQLGSGFEFPDGDLKLGDTWKMNQPIDVLPGMKFNISALFTLVGAPVRDGKNYLEITTDANMNLPKSTMQIPNAGGNADAGGATPSMSVAMRMQGKGSTLFDTADGNIASSTMHMTMNMTMWIPDPQSGKTTQAITAMIFDTTMKLVKKENEGVTPAPAATPAPAQ
ncbi:MAG TPA: hypothetical protein VGM23_14570 [Armatimonadota bacterium]|jgi:hypothetical protein